MAHAIHPHSSPLKSALSLKRPMPTEDQKITQQAQKWVAQTFYGTLLKQVRQSPFHSDKFDGGRGGQMFGAMLDQHLAEHMTRGVGKKLVNSIVRKIEAKKAYAKTGQDVPNKKSSGINPSLLRSIHATPALRA